LFLSPQKGGSLGISPSTSSGQRLRQAQGSAFDKLRAAPLTRLRQSGHRVVKPAFWGVSVGTLAHTPKCGTLHPEGHRGRRENPGEPNNLEGDTFRKKFFFTFGAVISLLVSALACDGVFKTPRPQPPSQFVVITVTPNYQETVDAAIAQTQTALAFTPDIQATIVAGVAGTKKVSAPVPDAAVLEDFDNIAIGKPVIDRAGGVNYDPWQHANDAADFNTTTKASGGRWAIQTNAAGGAYQIIDLGQNYKIAGVGYKFDWDAAFKNSLTFVVEISTDMETWTRISDIVHSYDEKAIVDINIPITPATARYVKFWEPPDGQWNGWGDIYALRVFAPK
jgi:hypothetical protein